MSLEWEYSQEKVTAHAREAYNVTLPSGIRIQVTNVTGEWCGYVYPFKAEVYLDAEVLEQTPPHASPEAAKQDIVNRLRTLMVEDLAVLEGEVCAN